MNASLRRPAVLLTGGLLASLFANGRLTTWPAAWLSGLLLVRYFRTTPGWRPWVFGGLGLFAVSLGAWFGVIPFPPPVFLSVQAQGAALGLLPFALDRLTHTRKGAAWWQTLVFPLAATGLALHAYLSSGTTWGALGYTQISFLPLAQLAAVTGIWGVGFIVSWFASWGNTAWEEVRSGRGVRGAGLAFPATLLLVLVGGAGRLVTAPATTSAPFAAAAISPPDLLEILTPDEIGLFQRHYMKQEVPTEGLDRIAATLGTSYQELFEKTRREARRGASVVFWPEASLIALGDERHEEALATLAAIANEEHVYLGAAVAYIPDDPARPNWNRVLVFGPEGQVVGEYHKSRLVPEVEQPFTRPGTGAVAAVDTTLGRLGLAICYDLDDPAFLAGLADSGVEVLVAPSGDWSAIKHLHSAMARFRAIETGVPLFRPANHGLSQVVDTRGRATASMDHDTATDRVLRAELHPGSVVTPYARSGDVFPWGCVLVLPVVAGLEWRRARRRRQPATVRA